MATVSTMSLTTYIDSLLGRVNTTLSRDSILAGMEDVVNKLEMFKPDKLLELHTELPITTNPTTLHTVSPTTRITCNGENVVRTDGRMHVANPYSLKNDNAKTTHFYTVGTKIYIVPFDANINAYELQGLVYGVNGSTLVWPSKYIYPLALFCTTEILYKELTTELAAIIQLLGSLELTSSTLTNEFAAVQTRLSADDVELAGAQLGKLRAYLEQLQVETGMQSVSSQNASSRINNAGMLLASYQAFKARYFEYFGVGSAVKSEA